MIKATDLRVGNIARVANLTGKVTAIDQDSGDNCICMSFSPGYEYPPEALQPIPITPEILEKCGFVKSDDLMGDFEEMYENSNGDRIDKQKGIYKWWHNDRYYTYVELKTLHQLQNLFFALTGEELTVNL